jgi:hypothetical protein
MRTGIIRELGSLQAGRIGRAGRAEVQHSLDVLDRVHRRELWTSPVRFGLRFGRLFVCLFLIPAAPSKAG